MLGGESPAAPGLTNQCQLVQHTSRELREAMEPLATFMDKDILANDPPSPWKKITSLRSFKEEEEETQAAMQGHMEPEQELRGLILKVPL